MKKFFRWILFFIGVIIFFFIIANIGGGDGSSNSSSTPVSNTWISKYAGGYTVEVSGYSGGDIESYVLRNNGTATWLWIVPDASQGARTESKKSGSWTASEGSIRISIRGNTGMIKEDFKMRNGRFYSTSSSDRYLKPTQ